MACHAVPSKRAIPCATAPGACWNMPPASRSPAGRRCNANTIELKPSGIGSTLRFGPSRPKPRMPPGNCRSPPTNRSPFGRGSRQRTSSPYCGVPATSCQLVPFQRRTMRGALPPPVPGPPPTTISPFARSWMPVTAIPGPLPSALHEVPFQRPSPLAVRPPRPSNEPPASTSPLAAMRRAVTKPTVPMPSADHAPPFHSAMPCASRPPAYQNTPPTTTAPLGRTASEATVGGVPPGYSGARALPNALHAVPFQLASPVTAVPPALLNWPPAINVPFGSTASA